MTWYPEVDYSMTHGATSYYILLGTFASKVLKSCSNPGLSPATAKQDFFPPGSFGPSVCLKCLGMLSLQAYCADIMAHKGGQWVQGQIMDKGCGRVRQGAVRRLAGKGEGCPPALLYCQCSECCLPYQLTPVPGAFNSNIRERQGGGEGGQSLPSPSAVCTCTDTGISRSSTARSCLLYSECQSKRCAWLK